MQTVRSRRDCVLTCAKRSAGGVFANVCAVFFGTGITAWAFAEFWPRWERLAVPVGISVSLFAIFTVRRLLRKEWRFGIAHMMALTACVAGILGLWRVEHERLARSDQIRSRIVQIGGYISSSGRSVDLRHVRISDNECMRLLEQLTGQFDVRELLLSNTSAGHASLDAIAHMPSLEVLALRGTRVTDADVSRLARLRRLVCLDVSETSIGSNSIAYLAAISRLQVLMLDDTRVDDEGVEGLRGLQRLAHLSLDGTRVTDTSVLALAHCSSLKTLSVRRTVLSDGGLVALTSRGHLELIDVRGTRVTSEGLRQVRRRFPGMSVLADVAQRPSHPKDEAEGNHPDEGKRDRQTN